MIKIRNSSSKKLKLKTRKTMIKSRTTVYIVRLQLYKDDLSINMRYWLGNSKPCQRCQTFMYLHNINKIKYTDIINGVNVLCEMKIIV